MEGGGTGRLFQPSVCFTVEKIIGVSNGYGNMKTYQVQWSPSWVSSAHLVGCEKLLQEFFSQHQHHIQENNDTNPNNGNNNSNHNIDKKNNNNTNNNNSSTNNNSSNNSNSNSNSNNDSYNKTNSNNSNKNSNNISNNNNNNNNNNSNSSNTNISNKDNKSNNKNTEPTHPDTDNSSPKQVLRDKSNDTQDTRVFGENAARNDKSVNEFDVENSIDIAGSSGVAAQTNHRNSTLYKDVKGEPVYETIEKRPMFPSTTTINHTQRGSTSRHWDEAMVTNTNKQGDGMLFSEVPESLIKEEQELVVLDGDTDADSVYNDTIDDVMDIQENNDATQDDELNPDAPGFDHQITALRFHHEQHQLQRVLQHQQPDEQQLELTLQQLYCEICDKPFSRRSYFIRHLRKHTKEKPFECEHCHRCFTRKFNLMKHIKNAHPDLIEMSGSGSTGRAGMEETPPVDDFH